MGVGHPISLDEYKKYVPKIIKVLNNEEELENNYNQKNMDISSEKAEIMRRFEQIDDISLIRAIKNLLDFGLSKQAEKDEALEASIDRGLNESKSGEVRPHEEVMAEIRSRYKA